MAKKNKTSFKKKKKESKQNNTEEIAEELDIKQATQKKAKQNKR